MSNKLSGGAVRRNLVKRHARAMFQQWCRERIANDAPGFDLVIRVAADIRALSRNAEFDEMRALFSQLAASVAGSTK